MFAGQKLRGSGGNRIFCKDTGDGVGVRAGGDCDAETARRGAGVVGTCGDKVTLRWAHRSSFFGHIGLLFI